MREERKKKEAGQELKKLRQDFNQVFNTPAGKRVLSFLMRECGYQRSSTVFSPTTQEVVASSTIYHEARRNVWLTVRGLLLPEILKNVENPEEENSNE